MQKTIIYILLFLFFGGKMFSTHIVGGEIIYDRINASTYKITLKVYRDCSSQALFAGSGGNSGPAILTVYEGNNTLVDTFDIGAPVVTNIAASINNPCIQPPSGICVEQGIYTYTLTLPPKVGGYYVIYQVVFRNASILNLVAPVTQGSTYYTFIPGPEKAAVNNSPRYNSFPPIYICNNLPFSFDHSATDPDGDQLVYSICAPYQGLSQTCPSYTTPGCPGQADPPPYSNVSYVAPYSGGYPISASPAFSVNSSTGLLTGKPNLIGQFVVGVCVQEFRGGVLINTHYRDFQFNVVPCVVSVASVFADQIKLCQGTAITFTNQSFGNVGAMSYHWDFGVNGTLADTSQVVNPTYNYPDTGTYVVTLDANPGKPCAATSRKNIYVYPALKVSFNTLYKQCLKTNSFNFNNTGSYINGATYNWNFSPAATPSTSTLKNPIGITYNLPGKYLVKLVGKQLTCRDSMIDSVRIIGRPKAKINNLPDVLCDPAKINFSNGSTSELPLTYKWIYSNGNTSTEFEPIKIFTPPGIYSATLMVMTSGACIDTAITSVQNITVNPTPIAAFDFSPTITTILDPEITFTNTSGGDNIISCNYNFGDGNSLSEFNCTYPYTAPGNYTIVQTVSNQFACTDTSVKEIQILPEFRFWIPNTFTPNNDGVNDIFMPKAIGVLKYVFFIYDKWGQQIYSGSDHLQGWNGTYKGLNCEQDVYVWKIDFTNDVTKKPEHHYGQVLLLRAK